jgi:SPP1 gp7 family putative phage head morphogenesis protein
MAAAAEERKQEFPHFLYDPTVGAAQAYIQQHGAELVTNLVAEQQTAIQAMVAQAAHYDAMTADSLSFYIRPVIGLTKPQAATNLRYYNAVKTALLETHPRMKIENAEAKAREAAAKYAGKQHRYRAMNIARTELASAYNQGGYGAIKDAQAQGYIGDCKKTWLTADDERVCAICGGIDGESVNLDAMFSIKKLLPPAHPSCRCAVAYEEVTPPIVPQMANAANVLSQSDQFRREIKGRISPTLSRLQKQEFEDIISQWDDGQLSLYDNLSKNFTANEYHANGGAAYWPSKNAVQMDIDANKWERHIGNGRTGAFESKLHEEFHQLEHLLGISMTGMPQAKFTSPNSINLNFGQRMLAAIDKDVLSAINRAVAEKNAQSIANGGKPLYKQVKTLSQIPYDTKNAFIFWLRDMYSTPKERAQISAFTDAAGLTTEGRMNLQSYGFWGHSQSYDKDRGKAGATSETWATMSSVFLQADEETKDKLRDIMPETYKTYTTIFDEIIEYAKKHVLKY